MSFLKSLRQQEAQRKQAEAQAIKNNPTLNMIRQHKINQQVAAETAAQAQQAAQQAAVEAQKAVYSVISNGYDTKILNGDASGKPFPNSWYLVGVRGTYTEAKVLADNHTRY